MRTRIFRSCLVAMFSALLCACAGGSAALATRRAASTATPTVWTTLEQRPLQIPHLAPGAPCPAAKPHVVSPSFGLGLGDGPAYPVHGAVDGVLHYTLPQNANSEYWGTIWGGTKVLWAVDTPHYPDVVLVRGRQLDGPNEVRFDHGPMPPTELRILPYPGTREGWTGQPSFTRVRAPGCYGYQIDGTTFSRVVIFAALPES
jgi:hypothetical protein